MQICQPLITLICNSGLCPTIHLVTIVKATILSVYDMDAILYPFVDVKKLVCFLTVSVFILYWDAKDAVNV